VYVKNKTKEIGNVTATQQWGALEYLYPGPFSESHIIQSTAVNSLVLMNVIITTEIHYHISLHNLYVSFHIDCVKFIGHT